MPHSISWCGKSAATSAIRWRCRCESVLRGDQELTGTSTNLSEGGMAVRIVGKLPKDAEGQVCFTLPGSNISLQLKGEVAWTDGTGHVGIRFIGVPQSSQYQLEKWLTERLQSEMPMHLRSYAALS